jgi:hypothetical protein
MESLKQRLPEKQVVIPYDFAALPESSRCSRGYKQVIIRLTSLTSNCTYYFNSATNQPYNHYFLEFLVSGLTANEHFRHIGATPAKFLERYSGGNVFGSELTTTFLIAHPCHQSAWGILLAMRNHFLVIVPV